MVSGDRPDDGRNPNRRARRLCLSRRTVRAMGAGRRAAQRARLFVRADVGWGPVVRNGPRDKPVARRDVEALATRRWASNRSRLHDGGRSRGYGVVWAPARRIGIYRLVRQAGVLHGRRWSRRRPRVGFADRRARASVGFNFGRLLLLR